MARGWRFNSIPGVDPMAYGTVAELPPQPLFIRAAVEPRWRHGSVVVYASMGDISVPPWVGREERPLRLFLSNVRMTDVVCEGPDDSNRDVEPANRAVPTWGGFRFAGARILTLSNEGRLLVSTAHGAGGSASINLGRSQALSGTRTPQEDYAVVERVATDVNDARVAIHGIGLYMGLEQDDAEAFAQAALDFGPPMALPEPGV